MSQINQLYETLFATIEGVKKGEIEPKVGETISKLSNNIIQAACLELNARKAIEERSASYLSIIDTETDEERRQRQGGIVHRIK